MKIPSNTFLFWKISTSPLFLDTSAGLWPLNYHRIVSLELSPLDDTILTGAVDDSVMVWDPRTPQAPIASIPLITGTPLVGFDPQGALMMG